MHSSVQSPQPFNQAGSRGPSVERPVEHRLRRVLRHLLVPELPGEDEQVDPVDLFFKERSHSFLERPHLAAWPHS